MVQTHTQHELVHQIFLCPYRMCYFLRLCLHEESRVTLESLLSAHKPIESIHVKFTLSSLTCIACSLTLVLFLEAWSSVL